MRKAQERAARRNPWLSSSDGIDVDDSFIDEDEDEEDDLNDEVSPEIVSYASFLIFELALSSSHDVRCSKEES